jgi:hypothetical protein
MPGRRLLAIAAALILTAGIAAPASAAPRYDRTAAASYMAKHWDDPARIRVTILGVTLYQADDCAWFASSVLWAGGLTQSRVWNSSSSEKKLLSSARLANPGPTKTVMLADWLEKYLVSTGQATATEVDLAKRGIAGAAVGDLIAYDWNDNGVIDHVSVVESLRGGRVDTAQHNINLHHQPWNRSREHDEPIDKAYAHPRAWLVHITG